MKKVITTVGLAMMVAAGSTFANAGIIIAGRAAEPTDEIVIKSGQVTTNSCVQALDPGIIIAGSAGIIIAGRGIDAVLDSIAAPVCQDQDPGIIIAGDPGIIIAG